MNDVAPQDILLRLDLFFSSGTRSEASPPQTAVKITQIPCCLHVVEVIIVSGMPDHSFQCDSELH